MKCEDCVYYIGCPCFHIYDSGFCRQYRRKKTFNGRKIMKINILHLLWIVPLIASFDFITSSLFISIKK